MYVYMFVTLGKVCVGRELENMWCMLLGGV